MDFTDTTANIPPVGFTHGGRFHADDVLSAALLRLLRPDIRIYRGFTVPKNFSGIVFDIGDGPFDHHAINSPKRPNGVPYAAFGLLWQAYGSHFLPEEEVLRFDEKFVQPLDLDDNTGSGNLLAALLGAFNPTWDAEEESDVRFEEAVGVAQKLLAYRIEGLASVKRAENYVLEQLTHMQEGVVFLPKYAPWKPFLVETEAEFVIFPSPRGGYSIQTIPVDYTGKAAKKVPFPSAWYGRTPQELTDSSGIEDFRFCHANGFMCTTGTLEGAREACRLSQEHKSKRMAAKAAAKEQNAKAALKKKLAE